MPDAGARSRRYWDQAARDEAAWYVATGFGQDGPDFFAQGAREVDEYLQFCGVDVRPDDDVLEIGCGIGRMTRRLAQLGAHVVATDVSDEMLQRARDNLTEFPNVAFHLVDGDGRLLGVPDASVDVVFSYITLQHVPSQRSQLRYLVEAARVLRPGGRLAVQVRAPGVQAWAMDWAGHAWHLVSGHRTLHRAWRGARLGPRAIRRSLAQAGVNAELRMWNRRHLWVSGSKRTAG
jgi:SAM-dependent methyltransferase